MVYFCRKFYRRTKKFAAFSLLEMVIVIGLSGLVLVSAMSLMLVFFNLYASSPQFSFELERDIFAKNLAKIFLHQYKDSKRITVNVANGFLENGIFHETNVAPPFLKENCGEVFTEGLAFLDGSLKFMWAECDGAKFCISDFRSLDLFKNVKGVYLSIYDRECNEWKAHKFSDETARECLGKGVPCCLRIECHGNDVFLPLFNDY